jgi:hypothetical protein
MRSNRAARAAGFLAAAVAFALAAATVGCGAATGDLPPASRAAGGGRVVLGWDPVPGAVAYNVYFGAAPGVTKENGTRIPNAANPITIRDLERGRRYHFVVTAVDAAGRESAASEEIAHTAE